MAYGENQAAHDELWLPNATPYTGDQGLFFVRNAEQLEEYVSLFENGPNWTSDIEHNIKNTQAWVAGDHSDPDFFGLVKQGQEERVKELHIEMGLTQEVPLPAEPLDHLIVFGGIQRGNQRRAEYTKRMLDRGLSAGSMALLGGQRTPLVNKEKEDYLEDLQQIIASGQERSGWLRHILESGDPVSQITWETQGIRLAFERQFGADLAYKRTQLRLENSDHLYSYEFTYQDMPVFLMHSLAVVRNGQPRHTTESCFEDWLKRIQPQEGARVGYVMAQPHLGRVNRSLARLTKQLDRSDLELVGGGSGTQRALGHHIYMGEIGRNGYEDQQIINAA